MEDYELILQAGLKKYDFFKRAPARFFVKSVMAGMYLGVAMILSLALGGIIATENPNIAKIAFSIFFGLTFVLIIFLNGELFTGNCLTTIFPILNKSHKMGQMLYLWGICLLGNSLGVIIFVTLFVKSGALENVIIPYMSGLVAVKMDFTIGSLFLKSILCNFIVCIATYVALKVKDEMAKTFIMLVVIMTFVLCGFDHCIANIGLMMMQKLTEASFLDTGLVLQNIIISTLGNVVGGVILLACPLYYMLSE